MCIAENHPCDAMYYHCDLCSHCGIHCDVGRNASITVSALLRCGELRGGGKTSRGDPHGKQLPTPLLRWHVCRVNFARKIFFELRIFLRKMLRNFPRKCLSLCSVGQKKSQENSLQISHQIFQISLRKIKKSSRRASAGVQGEPPHLGTFRLLSLVPPLL